jgi:hypothetical protein
MKDVLPLPIGRCRARLTARRKSVHMRNVLPPRERRRERERIEETQFQFCEGENYYAPAKWPRQASSG